MTTHAPRLIQAFSNPVEAMKVGRELLVNLQTEQWRKFEAKTPIQLLISERTNFIDQLLRRVWKHHLGNHPQLCLVAVGGYGRGELHPHSDIDILILIDESGIQTEEQHAISNFITYLWDIGLQVGHAIRTLSECHLLGKEDISTATNYTEARWLIGQYEHFDRLRLIWRQSNFWSSQAFFLAKLHEQEVRHSKAQDALAQLEPNIKESPGGLRDIHTLVWVAKRHFGANSLQQLVSVGFLSVDEYNKLERAMRFHWKVRFVLHSIKKRKEERLLFEHQKLLATILGYQDNDGKLAVENFMQDYYRNAKIIRNLNGLLLQLFREQLLTADINHSQDIDEHFMLIDNAICVKQENLFIQSPIQLLRVFLLLTNPQAHGIRANTQRLIHSYAHLINEAFCQQPETWQTFREILNQPRGVLQALRKMHQHGLLGRLLPAFHRITGLMQFDLFHAYTVDEHTLLVVKHLRQILLGSVTIQQTYPLACELGKQIQQPDILLLAGLFHDIAKGRGGDHALLGAEDARQFAQQANLSQDETDHLAWLVSQHLIMSHTAQKQDLSDPEVIAQFCTQVDNPIKLRDLYLLTLADVRATSPIVWNSWKDNLLKTLYHRALNHLQHQLHDHNSPNPQKSLLTELPENEQQKLTLIWQSLAHSQYCRQQNAEDLKRHAQLLLSPQDRPLIGLEKTHITGVWNLTLLANDHSHTWLDLMTACFHAQMNILSAQIYTSSLGFVLIDLKCMPPENWSEHTQEGWKNTLKQRLEREKDSIKNPANHIGFQPTIRQKHFEIETNIHIFNRPKAPATEISITTKDRPGLLLESAQIFLNHRLKLVSAIISTAGIRAEDHFILTNEQGNAVPDDLFSVIKQDLMIALSGKQT